jgi:carbonic anhydrase
MKPLNRFIFITSILFLNSCTSPHKQHWNYEGLESSAHWAELNRDFKSCQKGHHQSPIDLHTQEALPSTQKLVIAYLPTHTHIINNGHTIEFDMEEDNFIAIDKKRFKLKQLHFHADSEHTINGQQFPAEMHLVHQADDGKLAVISLLIEIGDSSVYNHIFDKIPRLGEEVKIDLSLESFIPKNRSRYNYTGSLTTPPCSENVAWLVFKQHLFVPLKQLQKFKAYYSHNYRSTQKMYDRQIYFTND